MDFGSEPPITNNGELIAGKYLVERLIGEGGMGVVVVAMHQELGERVALKFLRKSALQNAEIVSRFRNEARAAARLKSDHIARVLDVGQHNDLPFMIMEYLEGGDLSKHVQRGNVTVEDAVDFAIQACEGLAEAHVNNIVHRDIKPENLFLVEHHGIKTVKILDFGISKAALGGGNNFQTSSIMGSPVYMSPEQLRSTRDVDLRADVWSIGAVLFELLSGTTPFASDVTLTELIAAIALSPPRELHDLRPDIPLELAQVVMGCLQKSPAERWQNTGELAVALLPWAPRRAHTVAERAVTRCKAAGMDVRGEVRLPSYRPPPGHTGSRPSIEHMDPGYARTAVAVSTGNVKVSTGNVRVSTGGVNVTGNVTTGEPVSSSPTTAPSGRSNLVFGAIVGAVALALGGIAFVKLGAKPQQATTTTVTTATAAPAAAEEVDVILRAEPRETRFTIDDGQPLENPYVGKQKNDGKPHVIHARAPGYKEKTREVNFDRKVEIGLVLQKDAKAPGK